MAYKGINHVEHIYDYGTRHFYSFEQLQNLYGLSTRDFLKYFSLIKSVPLEWKEKLKSKNISNQPQEYLLSSISESTKICKLVYQKLVLSKQINPIKAIAKWELYFNKEIETNKLFIQPFTLTDVTKLRSFQYKYIMQIIPNNSHLL